MVLVCVERKTPQVRYKDIKRSNFSSFFFLLYDHRFWVIGWFREVVQGNMIPEKSWILNWLNHTYTKVILPQSPNFVSSFVLRPSFFELLDCQNSQMHEMTPNDLENVTLKSTLLIKYWNTKPISPFALCMLSPAVSKYKVAEKRKCTEWSQSDRENFLKYHFTFPRGSKLCPFRFTATTFWDISIFYSSSSDVREWNK